MQLYFLNFNEARHDLTNSPYLDQMDSGELATRLNLITRSNQAARAVNSQNCYLMRQTLLNIYKESFRDFEPEEQEALQFCFQLITQLLREKTEGSFFIPNHFTVKLAKLDSQDRPRLG